MSSSTSTPPASLSDSELQDHAVRLGSRLVAQSLRAATAESCTGGWIAKTFTDIAGSSDWFNGGVVTYSNAAKQRMLGVELVVLKAHGAVSEPVVRQMALGALDAVDADCAVSVSGVAGPGGGTASKPVGMVWIAAAVRRRGPLLQNPETEDLVDPPDAAAIAAQVYQFAGSRDEVRRAAVVAAIELLTQVLDSA